MFSFTMTTLGCKVNQYDGAAVAAELSAAGLRRAAPGERAHAVVVNTCCVTTTAMRKSRQALRRHLRDHPDASVLVTGCYADYDPDRLARLVRRMGPRRRTVVVAGHHEDVAAAVRALVVDMTGRPAPAGVRAPRGGPGDLRRRSAAARRAPDRVPCAPRGIGGFDARRRAFVKVQDGCDAFCSYCVVPYTRCRVRSRAPEKVDQECRRLVRAGHKEIVLCGVFLGAYGRETTVRRRWEAGTPPLVSLVRRIARIEGLWRLRLSSIAPGDVTDELLDALVGCPTAAPHLHLPLQSGSADVLRAMNRQYTPDDYRRAVRAVCDALDTPAITTDVIVGFPGASDEDFAATLAMAREAGFARIHAFPFSAIQPTAAWARRREAPSPDEINRRMERITTLGRELASAYRRRLVGRTLDGLVEGPNRAGVVRAMTDRYQPVAFDGEVAPGSVAAFEIVEPRGEGLYGRVVAPKPSRV
ncbi:MAG: radical SAM protein [Phycisphaerae bacterium]|nr:radical SAM protein [Phycisphaerae bacterium]